MPEKCLSYSGNAILELAMPEGVPSGSGIPQINSNFNNSITLESNLVSSPKHEVNILNNYDSTDINDNDIRVENSTTPQTICDNLISSQCSYNKKMSPIQDKINHKNGKFVSFFH